jgi:YidC/Oxa1 family membrane protein insertase
MFGSTIGKIFQPLFELMAWLIAFFYALVPNYAIAIALLTVVVMVVTAPLTVKSTRSMVAMQRLAPEMKKLQQKYKGDKQTLNEEMMKLYREHGVNPAGGCLPMLIQFPVFIILYDVIRGLTNVVKRGQAVPALHNHICTASVCSSPRYIGSSTKLFQHLIHSGGKMPAFGIDLAAKLLGQHSVVHALPYAFLILAAIALMYLQMRQLNSRNPQMAQANPQAQMMQRYMPILFAVIYINIAAGVNIYFIVSSLCRIGIQEGVFRSGVLNKPAAADQAEEVLPGPGGKAAPRRRTLMERLADAQKRALEQQAEQQTRRAELEREMKALSATGSDGESVKDPPEGKTKEESPSGDRQGQVNRRPGAAPERSAPPPGGASNRPSPNGAPRKRVSQSRSKAKRGRKTR